VTAEIFMVKAAPVFDPSLPVEVLQQLQKIRRRSFGGSLNQDIPVKFSCPASDSIIISDLIYSGRCG